MNSDEDREQQYDLLTAALLGAAVGATVTLLLRTGPSGHRPVRPLVMGLGRGAALAGLAGLKGAQLAGEYAAPGARWAAKKSREGARWAGERGKRGYRVARERGEELMDSVDIEEITDSLREYVDEAREAINEAVRDELKDLRKSVKKQRKRIGI